MKDTKRFFTLLIFLFFFIAGVFISGCNSPVGSLLVDPNTGAGGSNYIRAVPQRFLYDIEESFIVEDVDVYGNFGEGEKIIDKDDLKLKIEISPPLSSEKVPVDNKNGVLLTSEGINIVVISYLDMVTQYPIQVIPEDIGSGSSGGGGGTEIIINWPD